MIRIYLYCQTDRKEREERIARAIACWQNEEQARIRDGYVCFGADRAEKQAAGKAEGFPAWQVVKTERGKPFFAGLSDRYLSLSDTGNMAAVAIGDRELGIDLQQTKAGSKQEETLIRVAERFFPDRDLDYCLPAEIRKKRKDAGAARAWQHLDGEEQKKVRGRFFKLWTMKEAWCKYTGEGIGKDFLERSILEVAEALWLETREPFPDVLLSICTEREEPDLKLVYM